MTPRLMLDEMYPPALAAMLRDQGHDVLAIAASPHLSGSPDETVLRIATSEARCLVTENVADFAVLARRTNHHGLLFVQAQRWPRSPAGSKRLADALGILIATSRVPGPGEVGWLSAAPVDAVRAGLEAVREFEREHGAFTPAELAEAEQWAGQVAERCPETSARPDE